MPPIRELLSHKEALVIGLGAIGAAFAVLGISIGIAMIAMLPVTATVIGIALAVGALGGGIALLEDKTHFFSETLLPALKDRPGGLSRRCDRCGAMRNI